MKVRARTMVLFAASACASFTMPDDSLAVTTTFTNANGNLLWADPANWTTGVPTSADMALFAAAPGGMVDLGGTAQTASRIRLVGDGHHLGNGTIAFTGFGGSGDITATGSTLISADITHTGGQTVQLFSSNLGLTVSGSIYGQNVRLRSAGNLTGTNTYTGLTIVDGPTALTNAGSAAESSSWFNTANSLQLNYGSAGSVNKIGDSATITLARGDLQINNASGTQVNETVGTITLVKHFNSIKLTTTDSSAGSLNVSLPSIVRTEFTTALLDVNPAQGTRLIPTASTVPGDGRGGTNNLIYGWLMGMQKPSSIAVDGPLSFITYSDSRGLRPLDLVSEYIHTIDGSANDVHLTTPQTIPAGSRTAHSLAMHGANGRVTLDNAEVGITQGALALSAGASDPAEILSFSGTGTLSTFASEMHVWTDGVASNTHRYRVDVPMNVSNMTKSGPGTLVLSKPNTINGTIRVNQGTLALAAQGALGDADTEVKLRIGVALRFEGVSQNHGTLTMDAYQLSVVPNVGGDLTAFATVDVAPGIVATFDHVAGTGFINKRGLGRLRIAGDSSPAGASDISVIEGSLQIDGTYQSVPFELPGGGSSFNPFDVTGIGTNYVLGNGTIIGSAQISVAPGVDAPGRLTVGTLSTSLEPTTLAIELAGTTPIAEYDQLVTVNAARLQNRSLDVDLLNNFDPASGTQFLVLDNRGANAINGTFTGLPQNAVFFADGQAFQINYLGGDGNDVVLTAVVPEPVSTGFMLALSAMLGRGPRVRARREVRSVVRRG